MRKPSDYPVDVVIAAEELKGVSGFVAQGRLKEALIKRFGNRIGEVFSISIYNIAYFHALADLGIEGAANVITLYDRADTATPKKRVKIYIEAPV